MIDKTLIIYTDGSAITKPQKAFGSGIYIPELNISKKYGKAMDVKSLAGSNQYAELYAMKMALSFILSNKEYKSYEIISDSTYAINCLSTWRWLWLRTNKQPEKISNYKIIKECWDLETAIWKLGIKYSFKHVRGHNKDSSMSKEDIEGNYKADILATEASKESANR